MQLNLTREEFITLYLNNPYRIIKQQTGLSDADIAMLAKRLGLSKQVGRPKKQIKFKGN